MNNYIFIVYVTFFSLWWTIMFLYTNNINVYTKNDSKMILELDPKEGAPHSLDQANEMPREFNSKWTSTTYIIMNDQCQTNSVLPSAWQTDRNFGNTGWINSSRYLVGKWLLKYVTCCPVRKYKIKILYRDDPYITITALIWEQKFYFYKMSFQLQMTHNIEMHVMGLKCYWIRKICILWK